MAGPVWIDGRRGDSVSVCDRGFQYGDGLFETFLIRDQRPCLWEAHLARLRLGCERLGIPLPAPETLWREALAACRGAAAGVLKLQLTRGCGGRGYVPPADARPTRVFSLHPLPTGLEERRRLGVAVRLCRTPLGINPVLAGLKHCNRLEQVLARREWSDPDIYEGLMCDTEGQLVEGVMTNLFWREGERVLTPRLDRCGVAGVVRRWVMDHLQDWGVQVLEVRAHPQALLQAQEVFLTNSVIGIVPVIRWQDARNWPVGETTRRLQMVWSS